MIAVIHETLDKLRIGGIVLIRFRVALMADHTIAVQPATSRNDQEIIMAIGSAIERGSLIYVFDEQGGTLFAKARGNGPDDGLIGFTGSAVTVRFGSTI